MLSWCWCPCDERAAYKQALQTAHQSAQDHAIKTGHALHTQQERGQLTPMVERGGDLERSSMLRFRLIELEDKFAANGSNSELVAILKSWIEGCSRKAEGENETAAKRDFVKRITSKLDAAKSIDKRMLRSLNEEGVVQSWVRSGQA
jgi:hypothetical protein